MRSPDHFHPALGNDALHLRGREELTTVLSPAYDLARHLVCVLRLNDQILRTLAGPDLLRQSLRRVVLRLEQFTVF